MTRSSLRLEVSRETVRELDAREANLAAGGNTGTASPDLCLATHFCNTVGPIHCVGFSTAGCGSC
jgi:hypothetical protein